ncbi:hypothetical protein [Bacillus sp. SRB1LM]|uniref:hypothetical protein n=1 Tax=Bacillus sp. SRB1LM TaxID=2608688 RepID=UPI0018C3631A|nr:hypothetical protein [Bacillus sp. SRB1LM]MBG0964132.1 hypothetical protein [Bacillus sp. SRB1LM]MBG0967185.1 hypothetical protein [Bacillus sp. SRB1LM]
MDKKEIAKDLTVAYLANKAGRIVSIEDAVHAYEKFYEAVHRSGSVVDHDWIQTEDFVRDNK